MTTVPTAEFTLVRGVVQFFVAVGMLAFEGTRITPPCDWTLKWVWLRGLLDSSAEVLLVFAVTSLPLGEAIAITSLYPITGTLFSGVCLKEPVSPLYSIIIVIITAGIFLISQPAFLFGNNVVSHDGDTAAGLSKTIGYVCGLSASICAGSTYPISRVANTVNTVHFMLSTAVMTVALSLVIAIVVPSQQFCAPTNAVIWLSLIGQGLVGSVGSFGYIYSSKLLPTRFASVLQITDLCWGYVFQITVFRSVPTLVSGAGAMLIALSVLASLGLQPSSSADDTEALGSIDADNNTDPIPITRTSPTIMT
jgi:drug/metabolite transporter (DMT)-like permease